MNIEHRTTDIRPAKRPGKTLAEIVGRQFLLGRAKREAGTATKADDDSRSVSDGPVNFNGLPRMW